MERQDMAVKDYRFYIECDIDCYERGLGIAWNDEKVSEEQMQSAADAAYDRWVHIEENPEVESWCCEEYILHEVDKLGIEYDYCYLDKVDEE